MEIIAGLLFLAFIILLICIGICLVGISIIAGVIWSIFVSFASAIKSCAIGIKEDVSNLFIKIILFILLGIFVFVIVAPIIGFLILIILSVCGVL